MTKKVVRYKNVNGVLVKQYEYPTLVNGKVDIGQLPVVGTMNAAIIETGENANGRYTKFADGTMICDSTVILSNVNIPETQEVWNASRYTSPVAFIDNNRSTYIPYAAGSNNNISIYLSVSYYTGNLQVWNTGRSPSYVHPGVAVRGTAGNSNNVTAATIRVVAIGRWK